MHRPFTGARFHSWHRPYHVSQSVTQQALHPAPRLFVRPFAIVFKYVMHSDYGGVWSLMLKTIVCNGRVAVRAKQSHVAQLSRYGVDWRLNWIYNWPLYARNAGFGESFSFLNFETTAVKCLLPFLNEHPQMQSLSNILNEQNWLNDLPKMAFRKIFKEFCDNLLDNKHHSRSVWKII